MTEGLPTPSWAVLRYGVWRGANLLALALLLLVVLAFAVTAVPQLVGGEQSYVVLSGSMEPTLEQGDVVIVDAVDIDAVDRGDIVSFRDASGSVTTHRVVDLITDGGLALQTKGDANEGPDQGFVGADQLVGRVMTVGERPLVIPYIGVVIEATRSDLGVYALLFVPLTLLLLNEAYLRLGGGSTASATGGDRARLPHLAATNGGGDHPVLTHARVEGVRDVRGPASGGALAAGTAAGTAAESTGTADGEATEAGTAPRPLTLTPLLLLFVVPYGGWLALTTGAVPAAVLAVSSGVALLPVGYTRVRRRRADDANPPTTGLSRPDLTLATLALVLMVPVSAWIAIQHASVPAAMVAAGGCVALALLSLARLRLWWLDRRPRGDSPETPEVSET